MTSDATVVVDLDDVSFLLVYAVNYGPCIVLVFSNPVPGLEKIPTQLFSLRTVSRLYQCDTTY